MLHHQKNLQNHTHHSLGAHRLIAAVWSETRTWGQVLLNAAIDPRTEVKLYMKPVAQKWNSCTQHKNNSTLSSKLVKFTLTLTFILLGWVFIKTYYLTRKR